MKAQNRGGRFEERWHADILEPTRSVFILLREILPLVILLMILEQAGGAEHAACLVINSSTLSKPIYVSKCGGLPSITVRLPSACVLNGTAVEFVGSPPPTFTISGGGPKIEYKPDGPSWILGNGTGWAAVFHSGGESDSANLTITVTARDTDGHDHTMTSTVVLILLKQCDDGSEVEPGKACPDGQPTASLSSASPTDPLAPLTVSRSSVIQSAHSSENPAMSSFSGNVGASLKSVSLDFSMGRCLFGEAAGSVSIREKVPSSGLCTPACLFYDTATNTLCQVLYSGSYPRQFKMPEGLVDVITNSSIKYSLKFYASTNVGTFTNGLYLLSGVPFSTITIENLDGSGSTYNQLRITGNDLRTYDYAYGTNGWQLVLKNGLQTQIKYESLDTNTWIQTVRTEIRDASSNLVSYKCEKAQTNAWGRQLLESVSGSGAASLTNKFSYSLSSTGSWKIEQYADGRWLWSEHDGAGLTTNIYKSFGNQTLTNVESLCHRIQYDYSTSVVSGSGDDASRGIALPRQIVEKVLGQEISRTYAVYLSGETRYIRAANPGAAWNDSSNLVTITKFSEADGPFQDRVTSIELPDGTMQIFAYSTNTSAWTTNTVWLGQPNTNKTAIIDGTMSVVVFGDMGQRMSETTSDIASGIVIDSVVYSDLDDQKRPRKATYLDGTFTWTDYGCCGPVTVTNRNGLVTQYLRDEAGRQTGVTQNSITRTNILGADGVARVNQWIGTNGSTITMQWTSYDTAGRIVASTNALSQVTSYVYGTTNGQSFTLTTTPDGNTRTDLTFGDGRPDRTTGTAVHGMRYVYGVESESGVQRFYTKKIFLDASGNDTSEWTKTYQDMLGRTYKTSFSDGSFGQRTFNTKGQLVKVVDLDGVITLYQYNGRGELEYTAQDVDRNGTIDFSSTDRISRTERLVSTSHGFNVVQTRTYSWATNSSSVSNLMNLSEQSTDGLRAWNTSFNQTKTSVRGTPTGSSWTVTDTASDGSYSVTLYQQARLASVARYDSNGVQIASLSYSYDAHGRQSQTTDARNGTTVQTFNNADQVVTKTTPVPGTGQSVQTTSVEYDSMGRVIRTIYPDSTSMTNEYHPTGELKKTYGSRTYPVEYTYDYQGRMKTLKTWKDFTGNSGTATTTWNYDGYRGFLTNKAYADGLGPNYTYTAGGKLKTRAWVRGVTTTYVTNSIGEVVTIDYSDSTPDVSVTLDRLGRKTTLSQGGNTNEFLYNDAGQVISEKSTAGTLSGLALTNTYDAFLRRNSAKAVVVSPSSTLIAMTYGYDAAGRLTSITNGTYSATYSYIANSPLVGQIVFRDSTTTRMTTSKTYDSLNRLLSISSATATPVSSYAYQYNDANQRTRIDMVDGSFWSYEYDKLGQVISGKRYWTDGTPVPGQQYEYGFDDIGNRSSTKSGGDVAGQNLRSATYGANTLNQYTNRTIPAYIQSIGAAHPLATVTVNGQSTARRGEYFEAELSVNNASAEVYTSVTNLATYGTSGTNIGSLFTPKTPEVFSYDADGNLTNDGRWVYTWDGENRLTKMESQTSAPAASKRKVVYSYDYQSRMIARTCYTNLGGSYGVSTDTKFVFDGWRQVAELSATNNNLVRGFTWGLDLRGSMEGAGGIGGLLMFTDAATGTTQFPSYDGNGNVTSQVKASDASRTADYEYSPFGEVIRASGTMASSNPFRFSTKYQDDGTELNYYGYRFYNAATGRWLSRDPAGDRAKSNRSKRWLREQRNLYHFTFNDPVNRRDFLGLAVNDVDLVTFPVSNLSCPSTCGPDSTASVNAEIGRLRGYLAGLPAFPGHEEIWDADAQGQIATSNLSQFYLWFARLALSMNYDAQAKAAVKGVPLTGCPTAKCLGTVTLCGKCVLSDVAGNIMFGFAAAGAGIGDTIRNLGANLAESFDFDGQADFPMFGDPDRDVFPLGKDLFNSGSNDICNVLNRLPDHGKRSDCSPCAKASSFTPATFPTYPRYQ